MVLKKYTVQSVSSNREFLNMAFVWDAGYPTGRITVSKTVLLDMVTDVITGFVGV